MPVAPLRIWVLSKAEGVGQGLASSFGIGAFGLGNAVATAFLAVRPANAESHSFNQTGQPE